VRTGSNSSSSSSSSSSSNTRQRPAPEPLSPSVRTGSRHEQGVRRLQRSSAKERERKREALMVEEAHSARKLKALTTNATAHSLDELARSGSAMINSH
jgi:hypothetical protein